MENNYNSNQFVFGLYMKDESGKLSTITERSFDGNVYSPATRGQIRVRSILKSLQKRVQYLFASEVLDFQWLEHSLLKKYEKSVKLSKKSFEDKLFVPERKSITINEVTFTGVEVVLGLYLNGNTIFERYLYLNKFNPATRFSTNLYYTVQDIVLDIQEKILEDDRRNIWYEFQEMERNGQLYKSPSEAVKNLTTS